MAELVQLHIENTIPELEQMERIGLFTKVEIKKIIRKRTELEYTLKRRKKSKDIFIKYIQYELSLLSLIGKRRERLQCDFKKQEIDHAIAARINRLFKSATLRYQDDVKLWLSQIEFCKRMKWHHTISALFARMLQIHNSNPALWVMAAKWELEENNAAENARQLLQRALRYHPNSKHLWLEYFRMELMYTDMVKKRRIVLGLQGNKADETETDAVLEGQIASVIYKNATSKITDVSFALSFLTICQQFDFTSEHINDIFEDVQSRYPEAEEVLDAVAKRPLLRIAEDIKLGQEQGRKKKDVIQEIENQVRCAYEEFVKKSPTEKMWGFYIDFLLGRLEATKKAKRQMKLQSEVLTLMQRASDENCLKSDKYVEWTRLLCSSGDKTAALSTSLVAARKWPTKLSLWRMCLILHIECKAGSDLISQLFNEALYSIKEEESFPIWQLGMQWVSLSNPSKLNSFFERASQACKDVSLPMKEMYLEVIALQEGIQAARDLYRRLTNMIPVSPQVYKKMIQIENAQLKPSIEWLRRYYEDAIRQCGNYDVDLWLNFMKMETEHPSGDPSLYSMLYWRAMQCLDATFTDEFVTRATLYSTGHGLSTSK